MTFDELIITRHRLLWSCIWIYIHLFAFFSQTLL